jgi:hypothetical protein
MKISAIMRFSHVNEISASSDTEICYANTRGLEGGGRKMVIKQTV